MTHLTMQSMNGEARHFRVNPPMVASLGEEDSYSLTPDWGYPRIVPPLAPGETMQYRRSPEPGQAWKSDVPMPSKPMTPNNDERNLPVIDGHPLIQLPHRNYPGSFPHGWIDYEKMYPAVYPDTPPVPPGWMSAPFAANEKKRAIDLVGPVPAVPEDAQAYDISGFGSMQDAMHGVGQIAPIPIPPSLTNAAASAVTAQAEAAKAAGASTSIVNQIIEFGSSMASLYLQKRMIDQQKAAEKKMQDQQAAALAAQQAALAAQARAAGAPSSVVSTIEETPFYKHPAVIVGGAAAAVTLAVIVAKALSSKGKARGNRR